MIYLQDKGFNITAFYVTHPLLFERIKSDIAYLKSNGIQRTSIKIFTGMYNGKYYPSSFNSEQKEFLEGMEAEYPELEILNKSYNFYGQLCLAGQCFFQMDRNGNLRRCYSTLKNYGNLFEKQIKYDIKPKPCPKTKCLCTYEGIEYALDIKGNTIPIFKEDIVERSLISKSQGYNRNKLNLLMDAISDNAPALFSHFFKNKG